MSYDDQIVLPLELSGYGARGGPGFSTGIVRKPNGYEYRDVLRGYPLRRYTISFQAMLDAVSAAARSFVSYEEMYEIFEVAQGMGSSFRAKDPIEFTASASEGKFIATSIATEWQMVKRRTVGSSARDRIITKPDNPVTLVGGGTVDYDTGIVTNATIPTSWAGTFKVQVRFDTDEMMPRWFERSGPSFVLGWEDIPLVEVNEP